MPFPLAVPAPHVLGCEGLISRGPRLHLTQPVCEPERAQHWALRADDEDPADRHTLASISRSLASAGGESSRHGSPEPPPRESPDRRLPPVPVRKAHPQTFKELLSYSRPKHYPSWFVDVPPAEVPEEEVWEFHDSPSRVESRSSWRGLAQSASAPQLHTATSSSSVAHAPETADSWSKLRAFDGDPESLLSPFALQARRYGADVLITGERLRPSTGALFSYSPEGMSRGAARAMVKLYSVQRNGDWLGLLEEQAIPESSRRTTPASLKASSATSSSAATPPPPPPPAPAPYPRRPAARPPEKQPREPFRVPGRHAVGPRASRVRLAAGAGSPAPSSGGSGAGSPSPLSPEPAGPSRQPTKEASAAEPARPKPRLPAGPAGLWDATSKLNAVRDLLDGYAADPLGGTGSAEPRPGSAAAFLERYVERQAEIERLLHEQQGDSARSGRSRRPLSGLGAPYAGIGTLPPPAAPAAPH